MVQALQLDDGAITQTMVEAVIQALRSMNGVVTQGEVEAIIQNYNPDRTAVGETIVQLLSNGSLDSLAALPPGVGALVYTQVDSTTSSVTPSASVSPTLSAYSDPIPQPSSISPSPVADDEANDATGATVPEDVAADGTGEDAITAGQVDNTGAGSEEGDSWTSLDGPPNSWDDDVIDGLGIDAESSVTADVTATSISSATAQIGVTVTSDQIASVLAALEANGGTVTEAEVIAAVLQALQQGSGTITQAGVDGLGALVQNSTSNITTHQPVTSATSIQSPSTLSPFASSPSPSGTPATNVNSTGIHSAAQGFTTRCGGVLGVGLLLSWMLLI